MFTTVPAKGLAEFIGVAGMKFGSKCFNFRFVKFRF